MSILFRNGLLAAAIAWFFSPANATVVLGPQLASTPAIPSGELLLGELNCAACHNAADDSQTRLSPKLGKDGLRLTPQYLRKYLENPLKEKPGTTMPDMLHALGSSEKKQAVENLVHYLISEQDNAAPIGTGAEDFQIRQGRMLYHTVGCVACHAPQVTPAAVPGISAQDPKLEPLDPALQGAASVALGDLARKTTVQDVARFLIDPVKVRPSGRMPSLNLTSSEATSIAVYLLRAQAPSLDDPSKRALIAGLKYNYYESSFSGSDNFEKLVPKASGDAQKFELNHRLRDNGFGFRFSGTIKIPAAGNYTFYTLSDDGSRLYIDDKLVVDNDGDHAPEEKRGNSRLTAGDHSVAVTYYNNGAGFELKVSWRGPDFSKTEIPASVLSHSGAPMLPLDTEEFSVNPEKAQKGKELFVTLGCASCHNIGNNSGSVAKQAKSLASLKNSNAGCLSTNPPKNAARYDFSDDQRDAIRKALVNVGSLREAPTPSQAIAETMTRLNCYACHTRDGKGGPTDARLAYFRTVGEIDLGDEGRIPPHLTAVGSKLRPEWLRDVLLNKGAVRPYMATRMPQFGEKNVGSLPPLFDKADAASSKAPPEITQRDAKFGRRLVGVGGLSCVSCHTFAGHPSLGIPAMDLTAMTRRLRYDWFHRYVIDPASLRPGTRMPTFWPGGEAVNKDILAGNTEAQITAIWAYLSAGRNADLPNGLVQGKKEIVAQTEPIIYRNFIQGAGSRAIAVGYPEKVNLAFDANNMRLALIWQGAFIDAARHSNGRGEGFEPPLGNNIFKFPEGAAFAILENNSTPWPKISGKEAGYRMRGYALDEKRKPTFNYDFQVIAISDYLDPVAGEIDSYFKRTLNLDSPKAVQNLWFRAASGNISEKSGAYLVNNKVTFKFPGATPVLREQNGEKELLVPVHFQGSHATITEEIIW